MSHNMMKVLYFAFLVFMPLVYSDEADLWKTLDKNLKSYDNRIRPGSEDTPVRVNSSIMILRFYDYNEKRHSVKVDTYFRQQWNDPRLEISSDPNDELYTEKWILEKIWIPDTFFPASHNVQFHTVPADNSFVRIRHNGEVLTSQRINMEIFCQPTIKDWPRECDIEIESYGFSAADIRHSWRRQNGTAANAISLSNDEFLNHNYKLNSITPIEKTIELSSGNYTRIIANFVLDKN